MLGPTGEGDSTLKDTASIGGVEWGFLFLLSGGRRASSSSPDAGQGVEPQPLAAVKAGGESDVHTRPKEREKEAMMQK